MVGGTWLVIEVLALAASLVLTGSMFPKAETKREIRSLQAAARSAHESTQGSVGAPEGYVERLHPFYGFVVDADLSHPKHEVSPLGFAYARDDRPLDPRDERVLRIGFFGGSFAAGSSIYARTHLPECLASADDREIQVLNFGQGGYKQPQQLHVLADLYSLGSHLDVVINLDGFNEMALSLAENASAGQAPLYPRRWQERTARIISPRKATPLGQLALLRETRSSVAYVMNRHKLYRSPLLTLLWGQWDASQELRIYELHERIRMLDSQTGDAAMKAGVSDSPQNESDIYKRVADNWQASSIQMAHLTRANDGIYVHLLQPNQYVPHSKPMSEEEMERAFRAEHIYRPPIVRGYPILRSAGKELRKQGVDFHDLTNIFQTSEQPLYIDTCCHVTAEGYLMVVDRICDVVADKLETSESR
jgi:hypothetical protein